MKLRMLVYGCCGAALLTIPLLARRSPPKSEGYMAAIRAAESRTVEQSDYDEAAQYRRYFAQRHRDDRRLEHKIDRVLAMCEKGR